MGTIVSVNVGRPRTVTWRGRKVRSAIWKEPVPGPLEAAGVNLTGDEQADRRVHGGADKAVYAYASEDYDWWASVVGPLRPGTFGENLTTSGLDLTASGIGDRWRVGSAVLEVAQPRTPCFKLGIRMGDDDFPARFEDARRPGVYLRIINSGAIGVGDRIEVTRAEPPAVTVGDLVDPAVAEATLRLIADDARLPGGWRRAATRRLTSRSGTAGTATRRGRGRPRPT